MSRRKNRPTGIDPSEINRSALAEPLLEDLELEYVPVIDTDRDSDDEDEAGEALFTVTETELPRVPVLVLVGRPNVGKSTLFNRLTGTRDALVADYAGLTRDRQYGTGHYEGKGFVVVDTGGLSPDADDPLAMLAQEQARLAMDEADAIWFLTDAQQGLTPSDGRIADAMRKRGKRVRLLVNKAEGRPRTETAAEYYVLGLGEPWLVSAESGFGVESILRQTLEPFAAYDPEAGSERLKLAIVGKPNAGKSTLVNRLFGAERVLASEEPGTTRDAIAVSFDWQGMPLELIDTAGLRRRSRSEGMVEMFSIVKTLQAIERADAVILMVDAQGEISAQDAKLMGLVAHYGRGMVLAINKWDGLPQDQRDYVKSEIDYRLPFLDFVETFYISAKHGSGLKEMVQEAARVAETARREFSPRELTRVMEVATERHPPPAVIGRRIRLKFCTQVGTNPPHFVMHGNQTDQLPQSYQRYLVNAFREALKLRGVPLKLEFKSPENPFKNRKNTLTGRQLKKKRRMMDHTRRNS